MHLWRDRHGPTSVLGSLLIFASISVPLGPTTARGREGASAGLPHRRYQRGETLVYRMRASNRDATRSITYEAVCSGRVKQDPAGQFVVEYSWSHLVRNRRAVQLSADRFHQILSLSQNFKLSIPNLSRVHPALIGPITDLLTFYADAQLAMRQDRLVRPGDHVYIKNGKPNSWADGKRVLVGEDAIDFDITFQSIDVSKGTATVLVRHVPPKESRIDMRAAWMRAPVVDHVANNFVQINRDAGKYTASIGKETFNVRITLNRADGKIVSASMVNPVDVKERTCTDAQLANCGTSRKYQIMRKVRIDLQR